FVQPVLRLANASLLARRPWYNTVRLPLVTVHEARMLTAAPEAPISGDPRSAGFGFIELINAADALTKSGEARLCLKLYELWQQHHPADPLRYAVCFNHGALLAGAGQQALAAAAYAEAVRLAPDFLPAYINGGLALEHLGLRHQAIEQWRYVADRLA